MIITFIISLCPILPVTHTVDVTVVITHDILIGGIDTQVSLAKTIPVYLYYDTLSEQRGVLLKHRHKLINNNPYQLHMLVRVFTLSVARYTHEY